MKRSLLGVLAKQNFYLLYAAASGKQLAAGMRGGIFMMAWVIWGWDWKMVWPRWLVTADSGGLVSCLGGALWFDAVWFGAVAFGAEYRLVQYDLVTWVVQEYGGHQAEGDMNMQPVAALSPHATMAPPPPANHHHHQQTTPNHYKHHFKHHQNIRGHQ